MQFVLAARPGNVPWAGPGTFGHGTILWLDLLPFWLGMATIPVHEDGPVKNPAPVVSPPQNVVARWMALDKTQAAIILGGGYLFFSLVGNMAATKVTYLGPLVADAGFIYALTFTWRDLIHKQLGKKAAVTSILLAGVVNLLAALYYQLVVVLPAETDWAAAGGQAAWAFLFGIQGRVVLASLLAQVVAELADTWTYHVWTAGIGRNRPQWLRVVVSNTMSIPIDSLLFPIIAFGGVLGAGVILQMVWTNIAIKVMITAVVFWTIYLVPEKPIYHE